MTYYARRNTQPFLDVQPIAKKSPVADMWSFINAPDRKAELWTAGKSAATGMAVVAGIRTAATVGAVALGASAAFTMVAAAGVGVVAAAAYAHHKKNKAAEAAGEAPLKFFSRDTALTMVKGGATAAAIGLVTTVGAAAAFTVLAGVAVATTAGAVSDYRKQENRPSGLLNNMRGFAKTFFSKKNAKRGFWSLVGGAAALCFGEATAAATSQLAPAMHMSAGKVSYQPDMPPAAGFNSLAPDVTISAPAPAIDPAIAPHAPSPVAAVAAPEIQAEASAPVIKTLAAPLQAIQAELPTLPELAVAPTIEPLAPLPAIELPQSLPVAEVTVAGPELAPALPAAAVSEIAQPAPLPLQTGEPLPAVAPTATAIPETEPAIAPAMETTPSQPVAAVAAPANAQPAAILPETAPAQAGQLAGRCELRENFNVGSHGEADWPPPPPAPDSPVTSQFRMQCEYGKEIAQKGDYLEVYIKADNGRGIQEFEARTDVRFGTVLSEYQMQKHTVPEVLQVAGKTMYPGRTFVPTIR